MIMYDSDDKLLAASKQEVKLWDFYDHDEEAPELVTILQTPLRVEHAFVN